MRYKLLIFTLVFNSFCFAQCPFTVSLTNKGNFCLGTDTLVVNAANKLATINWYKDGVLYSTVNGPASDYAPNGITVAGGNGSGSANNQVGPSSIVVDNDGNVYACDNLNNRILKFPPNGNRRTNGVIIAGGNGAGAAANQLNSPSSIFVDAGGNLYVSDLSNNRIQKFPPGSTGSTRGITVAGGNGKGTASNQFDQPVCVFLDAAGSIYVVDNNNDRIQKFLSGAVNGSTVAGGNGNGWAAKQLNSPYSVNVDASGNIVVADLGNDRIQKFPANSTSATDGITIAGGNGPGSSPNQFSVATGIYFDVFGNLFVADEKNNRIQKFPPGSSNSTNGITIAGASIRGGPAANELNLPLGVFLDGSGNLFVADYDNYRVQKFVYSLIDSTLIPTAPGTYYAVVTDIAGCTVNTNLITILPTVTPTITIAHLANTTLDCTQTLNNLTFIATVTNAGTNPGFQWLVNNVNAGTNSNSFTANFANNDIVSCTLTSNAICATPSMVTSNLYAVSFKAKPAVSLITKANSCIGYDTLVVIATAGSSSIATISWYNGSQFINTVTPNSNGVIDTTKTPLNPGSYTATIRNIDGCSNTTNAVNIVTITRPSIVISASNSTACAGNAIVFTAVTSNGTATPTYQWQVNGNIAGTNSNTFSSTALQNNDVVICILSPGISCTEFDTSNSIITTIKALPVVGSAPDVKIKLGQNIMLNIPVTGDIASYSWSPAETLSSSIILHPVATPVNTTLYVLKVQSVDKCTASGSITVHVSSDIYIPSSFSPNNDGLNDIFYVLGGINNDVIKDFSIFNRWGKLIFQVQNVATNDRSVGWNGTYKGELQSPGGYVYFATIVSATGIKKIYKGTVILVK